MEYESIKVSGLQTRLNTERERLLIGQASSDPSAFRELYAHYFPKVYAYVAYRIRRKQDVEDVVADIFLKIVELLPDFEYRGENTFAAWIFRIAYNYIRQFWRGAKPNNQMVALDDLPDIRSESLSPYQEVLRKERFHHLVGLIHMLSPRRQEIVTLRFFGGLRNQEIAKILDLDERTIAAHLSRGLRELRNLYVETLESE